MRPTPAIISATLIACAGLVLGGCGQQRAEKAELPENHPMVVTNPGQLADLYWNGRITSSDGARWDVAYLPGMNPTGKLTRDSLDRALGYLAGTGDSTGGAGDACYEFAFKDCMRTFVGKGIAQDYRDTSNDIATLTRQKPFGWPAALAWEAVKGYVAMPVGRTVIGGVGCAGGAVAGTVLYAGEGTARGGVAVADVAAVGTAWPTARYAWHHIAFPMVIITAEPTPDQNGRWGLSMLTPPTVGQQPVAAAQAPAMQ